MTDCDLAHQRWCALSSFGPSQDLDSSAFFLPCAGGAQGRRLYIRSDEFVKVGEERRHLLS